MNRSDWRRSLTSRVLTVLLFAAVVVVLLWISGRHLTIRKTGGDQNQSSRLDFGPGPVADPLPRLEESLVRNVILIIGDGMGFSQIAAARVELQRPDEPLFLERFPVTGWLTTHSLRALLTDSASSATSLATGHKVPSGVLSLTSDGRSLKTVLESARDRGMATGVVTDSYLWDATPAAFLTHVSSRDDFPEIARQMAASGADLLIGESHRRLGFESKSSRGGVSALETFQKAGFQIVREPGQLEASRGRRLVALFESGSIADPARPPGLVSLARFAIEELAAASDGFFLIIESEEPDTGGHSKNLGRIVRGVHSIDQVAAVAVEQALEDRSTLVLVTADHETGGLSILRGHDGGRMGVRWATSGHTSEPVPIYAFGPEAERFGGARDNTDIARILSDLLELDLFAAQ